MWWTRWRTLPTRPKPSAIIRPVSAEPWYDEESVRTGRELFISENCWKSRGRMEGQTEWLSDEFLEQASLPEEKRIEINYDAWNQPHTTLPRGCCTGVVDRLTSIAGFTLELTARPCPPW